MTHRQYLKQQRRVGMKIIIKWLCFIYFSIHNDVTGLVFYNENIGGIKIKFEATKK